jgi:hypothetical protein
VMGLADPIVMALFEPPDEDEDDPEELPIA